MKTTTYQIITPIHGVFFTRDASQLGKAPVNSVILVQESTDEEFETRKKIEESPFFG